MLYFLFCCSLLLPQKEMYGPWIDVSFTKWHCLGLTQYDRICFVDADKIMLTNIDDIFQMAAPAGIILSYMLFVLLE